MPAKLHLSHEEVGLAGVCNQLIGGQHLQNTAQVGLMVIEQRLLRVPRRPYDDVINIGVGILLLPQYFLHDPLKNGIAILQTHDQHLPAHDTSRGTHAG